MFELDPYMRGILRSGSDIPNFPEPLPNHHLNHHPKGTRMTLEQLREALTPKPWPSKTARTGPLSALRKAGRLDRGAYPYWADHQYTGTDPNTGARMYGASPYQLAEADLADLAFLAGEGWGVSVHAHSVYGLGTVQVVLREPGR